MKRCTTLSVFSLIFIFLFSQIAFGVTSTADIHAIVAEALEIEWDEQYPLAFGTFLSGSEPGTVTIGTDGDRSFDGDIMLLGGIVSEARFNVIGAPNTSISITLPTNAGLYHQPNNNYMSVESFISNPGGPQGFPAGTGTLDEHGELTIHVGATVIVSANQLPGVYSGEFEVTVNYE